MDQGQERAVLQLLTEEQKKSGYLPKEFIDKAIKSQNISADELQKFIKSFPFLRTQPKGRNVIMVCKGKPCLLRISTIMEVLKGEIGIGPGETTLDGKFSIELVNCLSACDEAPVIEINGNLYVEITPSKVSQILKDYE